MKIRSKLLLSISVLMIAVLSLSAYLLIKEKREELAVDIFENTLAFTTLTAEEVALNYDLYLAENSFVYFNREMQGLFEKNEDVSEIEVISFAGEVLYDSGEDVDKRYDGAPRQLTDESLLIQVQSENISVRTLDGRTVFLKGVGEDLRFVDENENEVEPLEPGTLVAYFVIPGNEKYSILYEMDYSNLEARIQDMVVRIVLLAAFGILLGTMLSFLMASGFTRSIAKLVIAGVEIAKGNFQYRVQIKSADEIGQLGKSFNVMAQDLEKSVEAKVYQERVTRELELASEIQKQIVPKVIPRVAGMDIAANLLPAGEIGGDMYDFLPLSDKRMIFYLGDVTGHGVPAGIVSSIASALFYGYAVSANIQQMIVDVNRVFAVKTMPNIFMTLCLMDWNAENASFSYVSAGHEQLIHYQAATGKAVLTPAGGLAIGMIKDLSKHVKPIAVNFQPGDYLVVYSDGIPEGWKSETESYGMERFVAAVESFAKTAQTAKQLQDMLLQDLQNFTAGYEQMDDVTIIVMKRV